MIVAMTGMAGMNVPAEQATAALGVLSLWGAFLLGLAGGFTHCMTMCGPLVAAASMTDEGVRGTAEGAECTTRAVSKRAVGFQLSYHAGRLLMYALIGALLGLAGMHGVLRALAAPLGSVQVAVGMRVVAGIAIVAAGVWLVAAPRLGASGRLPEPTAWLARQPCFAAAAQRFSRGRWGLPLGMLMALLPCMPLLPIEIAALASASVPSGVAIMLAFGLGTLPALVGAGAVSALASARSRAWLAPAAGVLVIALGLVALGQAALLLTAS